jgi:GTPase Era involved in 16S rRNA processing
MSARFAMVGHPNKGKSSIVATLAEDDAVVIAPEPGTTTRAREYPMRLDGELLYTLIDTPGFQRARETLAWLEAHERGADERAETVSEFVRTHIDDPRFRDECELLKPIVEGAGILYVVDGSRPYNDRYQAEMEILRWTGQPRMALINLIGSGDHVDEWRSALGQYFSIVRVFDAMEAHFSQRIELLRAFGAIDERWSASLERAADALMADREHRKRLAARAIAELLTDVLTETVTLPLAAEGDVDEMRQRARGLLQDAVRRRELRARRVVQELYRHSGLEIEESAGASLAEDVFSTRSFSVFGLSAKQLAVTGAASGALLGGAVDVALGGASLMLGAGIGAAIGAVGTIAGAREFARVRVLGQRLGGHELRVGPFADPNLPWVVLGRARLHLKLVAERNHARREALVLDARQGGHLADAMDATQRRTLDALFKRVRRGQDERAALAEAILSVLDA